MSAAEPGTVLFDRYRVVRRIAAGGMGTVFEARDLVLDQPVALKRVSYAALPDDLAAETRERTLREARNAAQLRGDPHVVAIYDVQVSDDDVWLVLEYLPSRSLAELTAGRTTLDVRTVARVGATVARGLAAAHHRGITHRDVKPGNILIATDGGAAKLTDFGISHAEGESTLTATGQVSGTPAYMAREVARGEDATPASDVFSLAATLYAAVEGTGPFGSQSNPRAMVYRVANDPVRPPEQSGPLTSPLLAMMHDEPTRRPDATTVAGWLDAVAAGDAAPDSGPPPPSRPAGRAPGPQTPGSSARANPSPDRGTPGPPGAPRGGSPSGQQPFARPPFVAPRADGRPPVLPAGYGPAAQGVGGLGAAGQNGAGPGTAGPGAAGPGAAGPGAAGPGAAGPGAAGPGAAGYGSAGRGAPGNVAPQHGAAAAVSAGQGAGAVAMRGGDAAAPPGAAGPARPTGQPRGPAGGERSPDGGGPAPQPDPAPAPRRRRTMVVAGVLAAALLAVVAVVGVRALTSDTAQAPAPVASPRAISGDPRAADPCPLLDLAALGRFGAVTSSPGASPSGCRADVTASDGRPAQVSASFDRGITVDGGTQQVGDLTVQRGRSGVGDGSDARLCVHAVVLPDGNQVLLRAYSFASGVAPCDLADTALDSAVAALQRDGVRYAPDRNAGFALARADACQALDPAALGRAGVGAAAFPGFASWSCSWGTADDYASVSFGGTTDRTGVAGERGPSIAGRRSFVEAEQGSCAVTVAHRDGAGPDDRMETVTTRVRIVGAERDRVCGAATDLATVAESRLPE